MSISASTVAIPSEFFGPPLDLSKVVDIWEGFCFAIANRPDALALVCTHQAPNLFGFRSLPSPSLARFENTSSYISSAGQPSAYLRWSFGTLGHAISSLVASLGSSVPLQPGAIGAIGPRTPIITFLRNGAEFVLAAWASVATGCVLVPLNPLNLTNTEEVTHMLRTALRDVPNGKRRVIFAADEGVARRIDGLEPSILGTHNMKILATGSGDVEGWIHMEEMIKKHAIVHELAGSIFSGTLDGEHHIGGGLVLFTSGTTSRPKGLFVRHTTVNIFTNARLLLSSPEFLPGPGSSICSVLPNNHGNGWSSIQAAHGRGAALIFPGPAFTTPELMLDTLRREGATHTLLVSTLVYSLVAAMGKQSQPLENLKSITFGGMGLTRDVLDVAMKELGATAVENAYGCTEGVLLSTGSVRTHPSTLNTFKDLTGGSYTQEVSVGRPPMGHGIRIVDPETGSIVPRNTLGEIHGCGPMVNRDGRWGYIGEAASSAFYMDDKTETVWFRTGDEGWMDESGMVFVTGRYKDMIVRGGENISPAAIESVLSTTADIRVLDPQVVGARDDIAGEIPIVLIRGATSNSTIKESIRETVIARMGTMYAPDYIICVEDMGIHDYPRTASGKIQKLKLRELVSAYLANKKHVLTKDRLGHEGRQQLSEQVRVIWAASLGLESPSSLDLNTPIIEFADSISIMRVRDRIMKNTGRALSLASMIKARTIAEQVDLLQLAKKEEPMKNIKNMQRDFEEQSRYTTTVLRSAKRGGPPSVEDMVHLTKDPTLYGLTRKLILEAISPYGLGWDDVEDVMPAYDSNALQAQCGFYETINFHLAIVPVMRITKNRLRCALETAMRNHPITCSFMVWESDWASANAKLTEALHVVMRPSSKFFDLAIHDGGALSTLKDLEVVALGNTGNGTFLRPEQSTFPGPLYRASLFDIAETGGAAMVVSINHAISDHLMGQMLHGDLDQAIELSASTSLRSSLNSSIDILSLLPKHKDYKTYLDLHYTLYDSPLARASVKWHVDRLSSLPAHIDSGALWPPSSAFLHLPIEELEKHYEETIQVKHSFDVPALREFRREYPHVTSSTIVKAATALAIARKNGYTAIDAATGAKSRVSIFSSVEAARSYYNPFLPKSIITTDIGHEPRETLRWEATDVAGPTVQIVCNMVEISIENSEKEAETVLQFLGRMQAEQHQQTKHSAAPWRAIMAGIVDDKAYARHWPLLPLVHGTLMFNWAPELGEAIPTSDLPQEEPRLSNFTNFRMLKSVQKPRVGLVMTAGAGRVGGQTSSNIVLLLKGAGLDWDGMRHFAGEIESIVKWLTEEGNMNLSVKRAFDEASSY